MSNAKELLSELEQTFRENSFDSRESIVRVSPHDSYLFQWTTGSTTVKGELESMDSIGLMVTSLTVEKDLPEGEERPQEVAPYLQSVAAAVEKKINYLMEPLKVIELDTTSNVLQMRSERPEVHDGAVSYFELLLKSGKWFGHRNHISIIRYSQNSDQEGTRKPVSFALTKRQFERLVDDLLQVL